MIDLVADLRRTLQPPPVLTIDAGECWCATCGESAANSYCHRCGARGGKLVPAIAVLRSGEYVVRGGEHAG